VGATMGPENGDAEIACQSQLGGVITTGGGFSTYYATPSWQTDAVNAYFDALTASNTPDAGYNRNGRGYPDVSLIGVNYQVVIQGGLYNLYGTSASAPLFGAMLSLINAVRVAHNKSSVGFINPTLYAYGMNASTNLFTDVTSGHNRCCASGNPSEAVCCDSGFHSTAGWDPVTGWGSTYLPDLAQMLAVEVNYTLPAPDDSSDSKKGTVISLVVLILIIIGAFVVLSCIISCIVSVVCSPCRSRDR
jgi:tripeptidyl-peptidase-1